MLLIDNKILIDILIFSKKNSNLIRKEFYKMAKFYTNSPDEMIEVIEKIKDEIVSEDYYSNIISSGVDQILNNLSSSKFVFNEFMLLDSVEKIQRQILDTPQQVIKENNILKIFFYDLLDTPDISGSRIVLSKLKLDWRNFESEFYALSN